jgi:DNA-binding Lrp family transcriptional regulator
MILSIEGFLTRSPATSKEIQVATGLSQTAVSRRLRDMESRIVPIKSGRSVRYAITRNAFGGDDSLPLFMATIPLSPIFGLWLTVVFMLSQERDTQLSSWGTMDQVFLMGCRIFSMI